MEEIAKQRTAEANGAPIKYIHIVLEKDEITAETPNDIVEASEYYRTLRGQHKNADNLQMFSGNSSTFAFHAFSDMDKFLTQPILIIAGTKANSIWQSELAYSNATVAKSRELYKIEGATHMDLYDIEKYVNQAVDRIGKFFSKNL